MGVYEFSHLFPGELAIIPIFIVPGLLVCIVLAMPFLAKHVVGQVFNVLFTIAVLVALVALSYHSLAKDRDNPEHQKAIALEKEQAAARVRVDSAQRRDSARRRTQFAAERSQDARTAAVYAKLRQLPRSRHRQRFAGRHQGGEIVGAEPGPIRQPTVANRLARPQADQRSGLLRQHETPRRQDGGLRQGDSRRA